MSPPLACMPRAVARSCDVPHTAPAGVNRWLERSFQDTEQRAAVEETLSDLELEYYRVRDQLESLKGPREICAYLMELLRPGGPLVVSKQDAAESRMPQHVVKDGVPVPVTHEGQRELLQVLISCRRQLMQLQRISATQGTESAPGLAAQAKRVAGLLGTSLKQFVARAGTVAAEIGNQDALASLFAVRGRDLLCKIPNLIAEIDPIEMLHKAVAFEKVVCVKMILDNYPDSGLLHRVSRAIACCST